MTTYQMFIDDMVELASRNVSANRIREHSHAERTNDKSLALDPAEQARKDLLLSLTSRQRELVADMLVSEREEAVHDLLAYLEWAVTTDQIQLTANDTSFADQIDVSMHADFIDRLTLAGPTNG